MKPTVSIIIPCRNEEQYIVKCIESIVNCNYPSELLSVYVCDGMSDDNTRLLIEALTRKHPHVHLLDNVQQSTPFALNIGLKKSESDIKIILGAHAEIDKEFVQENVNAFEINPKIGCTGGVITNVYENETAEIVGYAMSSSFGVGNAHFRTGNKSGYVDTVAFGAYKKEVFDKIGYFDEELVRNQDDEFNFRLLKSGFKIYLSEKVSSKYYVRGSFSKLYKQYFQYGYWKVFVNKKHKTITTVRQLIPLFFVMFLFGGALLALINKIITISYLSILVLYALAAFWFAINQAPTLKKKIFTAFTFFLLHLGYGLGYAKGLISFLAFNKKPSNQSKTLSR